jgi:zinc and cadmium transporter
MSTLAGIILATGLLTVLSVLVAMYLSFKLVGRYLTSMLCVAAGLLLTVAFTHLLPEAFEAHEKSVSVGWTLLASVLSFYAVERIFQKKEESGESYNGRGGFAILLGDGVHNFTDGLLIASAFMVDAKLGWITALAIMTHEIPQEVGDFFILIHSGFTKARAVCYNIISGLASVLGGICGFYLLDELNWLLPYAFAVAAASFIYIALSDLIPVINRAEKSRFAVQMVFICIGVLIATLATGGFIGPHVH